MTSFLRDKKSKRNKGRQIKEMARDFRRSEGSSLNSEVVGLTFYFHPVLDKLTACGQGSGYWTAKWGKEEQCSVEGLVKTREVRSMSEGGEQWTEWHGIDHLTTIRNLSCENAVR